MFCLEEVAKREEEVGGRVWSFGALWEHTSRAQRKLRHPNNRPRDFYLRINYGLITSSAYEFYVVVNHHSLMSAETIRPISITIIFLCIITVLLRSSHTQDNNMPLSDVPLCIYHSYCGSTPSILMDALLQILCYRFKVQIIYYVVVALPLSI